MARLFQTGYEIDPTLSGFDGATASGTVTKETTVVRSGAASIKCNGAAGNVAAYVSETLPAFVASQTYFARTYFCFANLPGGATKVSRWGAGVAADEITAKLTAGGKLQLFHGSSQLGSDSVATIVADGSTWYRVELSVTIDASRFPTACELQLDGVSVATGSSLAGTSLLAQYRVGWFDAPGANNVLYLDDTAVNDDQGASQNSWPGSGKVVLLVPTADSARGTGWVNDANGTTNFFQATDNTPPQGIADTTASTGLHQIRNGTANANSNYDATMTTYTVAGVGASDTINVLLPVVATAAPVSTGAKLGTVGVVSNPAIANVALGAAGTAGAFWQGNAASTYVSGWKLSTGTATYAPSVTLGTAPVMRITQVTSSTRIAMVCFMGIYVDYTPAASGTTYTKAGHGIEHG